jgi:hypothetical protein
MRIGEFGFLLVIVSMGFTYSSASKSPKYSAVVFRNSAFRDPARRAA